MNQLIALLVAALLLVALAVVLLGVKALFVKGGRFPSPHVHDHPELTRRGVRCMGHGQSRQPDNKQ